MYCIKLLLPMLLVYGTAFLLARAEPYDDDKHALLDFIANINHSRSLNWDERTFICNSWIGVTCNHDSSRVIAVRLPGIGFTGNIPPNTLSRLSALRILSLRSNGITGLFPADFLKLENLRDLYLQNNNFQGMLPSDFSGWKSLAVLNLSKNGFSGNLPSSLSNLTTLTALDLSHNLLSGQIPDFNIPSLQILNVSNNNLSGVVPTSLLRFPSSAFSGNNISIQNSFPPALSPSSTMTQHSSGFSEATILGIVIGTCVVAFLSMALLLLAINRKKKNINSETMNTARKKEESTKKTVSEHNVSSRMTFFEGCNLAFDLEDLLSASADVLGKGTFGTTYKAALEDATLFAVKRLKEVVVGKKDFEQQMEVVGNLRHENVAPLRAYFFSKDERLLVYDYYNQGSASFLLHVKRGENRIPLDWETRIRIAVGAARGISHIHDQRNGNLVHGNIKSSNIFLNSRQYGCVCDLGLATLMSSSVATRMAGYRAPEVVDTRKVTQPSDVYSLGVVLLELLTGKSPVHAFGGEERADLVRWVQSVVREEWTGEVFDVELLRYQNIEEEMVALLQVGMSCVARTPAQRPKIRDVLKMVEDIRSVNTGKNSSSPGSTPTPTLTPHGADIGSSSIQ